MQLHESAEMYLETIYRLSGEMPVVRSIDVAQSMGYSKPSVSRAISLLRKGGYVNMEAGGHLILTPEGLEIARKVFERHQLITKMLVSLGVDASVAADDACRIEHVISDASFDAIRKYYEQKL